MRILFLGDVMGRAGRDAVSKRLKALREQWRVDFCVVNGENASNGAGLTTDHANILFEAGADCVTLGDHAFDQKDMMSQVEKEQPHHPPAQLRQDRTGAGARASSPMRAGARSSWCRCWGRSS